MHASALHVSSLITLPAAERAAILDQLTTEEAEAILYDWRFWARPNQLEPPGEWSTWLLLAGRGFGKSRTGAEYIRDQVEQGKMRRIALVARTAADVRDVVVEGEAGILAVCPPWNRPEYFPSKRRLVWPNGAIATTFSGDEPDQLRGPAHDGAWADECAAWRYSETWDMLMFGLRLGANPRCVATTTPRPTPLIKSLIADPTTFVTRGSTYDNRANLAPKFFQQIIGKYEGTRLGRQELNAEILDDVPGALWTRALLEQGRVRNHPLLVRIVVSVDPQASTSEGSSETGIIVVGLGTDGHGYVLDDLSVSGTPSTWAGQAITGYYKFEADRIVGEANNGGDMVENTVRAVDANVSFKDVHASRGKRTRAEPVAALYEQGRIHHVGMFAELEDQLCSWVPSDADSPDRMDALVWGVTELMLGEVEERTTMRQGRVKR